MKHFFISRGRLLKSFWFVLDIAPSTSSENELRPPTGPINSGFTLPKKEDKNFCYNLVRPLLTDSCYADIIRQEE